MPQFPETTISSLLRFNVQLVEEALSLVAEHDGAGRPAYAGPVGRHLRHVIEHYAALLWPTVPGVVDYDQRPRDPALERSGALARKRLLALRQRLGEWAHADPDAMLSIRGRTGPGGEWGFAVASTIGRELVSVASHAVHHFALLHSHCVQNGIPIGENFGRAPATVAHERDRDPANAPVGHSIHRKELSCPPLVRAA